MQVNYFTETCPFCRGENSFLWDEKSKVMFCHYCGESIIYAHNYGEIVPNDIKNVYESVILKYDKIDDTEEARRNKRIQLLVEDFFKNSARFKYHQTEFGTVTIETSSKCCKIRFNGKPFGVGYFIKGEPYSYNYDEVPPIGFHITDFDAALMSQGRVKIDINREFNCNRKIKLFSDKISLIIRGMLMAENKFPYSIVKCPKCKKNNLLISWEENHYRHEPIHCMYCGRKLQESEG